MKKPMVLLFHLSLALSAGAVELKLLPVSAADDSPTTVDPPGPALYAFGYAAGRYPGNIDRTHSEVSDGSGVVRGSYSYVDPLHRIRTVDYTADKDGFHPISNQPPPPPPKETAAVAAARERHRLLFEEIAARNAGHVVVPADTAAVERAKQRHLGLFERIAREHARIKEEREKEGGANELEE